jgi:hypothetical protein
MEECEFCGYPPPGFSVEETVGPIAALPGSDGSPRTVGGLATRAAHEAVHHTKDLEVDR